MAESSITSAVALPDSDQDRSSPEGSRKRRQSLQKDRETDNSKRRRVSAEIRRHIAPPAEAPPRQQQQQQQSASTAPTASSTSTAKDGTGAGRKPGREEERKRGQRLFGSLLGTLSQTSSSAAQQRRADIEKKQQAKLKSQDAEYDEGKKRRYEELMAVRRRDQKILDRQSMELRHSNMLAMAHSLKTTEEPVLYYKPWQLRPEDESRISEQIEEAKSIIAKEVEEFDRLNPPPSPIKPDNQTSAAANEAVPEDTKPNATEEPKIEAEAVARTETVGADTNKNDENEQLPHAHPTVSDTGTNDDTSPKLNAARNGSKAPEDEGEGVMLEDQEDTVIY